MNAHAYHSHHACKRPDVANLDHFLGGRNGDVRPIVNRVCLTCMTHWYGDADTAVFEIPSRAWDRWMESGLTSRAAA